MPSTDIFHFFLLPRELRDLIYLFCLTDSSSIELINEFRFRVSKYPLPPHLFLINEQFRHELREVAQGHSSLEVYSVTAPGRPNALSKIPAALKIVKNITCNIDCWRIEDLETQNEYVDAVLGDLGVDGMKGMSYHVNVLSRTRVGEFEAAILWTGMWIDQGNLSELKILRNGVGKKWAERTLLSRWDRAKRQFVQVNEDWVGAGDGENVGGPSGLMWQGEVAYLFE